MPDATCAQRLRLAIAICALRHKPVDQPLDSYIADLRSHFTCDGLSQEERAWRERAQVVEGELADLQSRYHAEHAELQVLKARSALPRSPIPTSAAAPAKKKQKKKTATAHSPHLPAMDLKTLLAQVHHPSIHSLLNPASLTSAFSTLQHLAELSSLPTSTSDSPSAETLSALHACTLRALSALGALLASVLPPRTADARAPEVCTTVTQLLHHLIHQALPLLAAPPKPPSKSKAKTSSCLALLDALLASLSTHILLPALRALHPLSLALASALLDPKPAPKSKSKRPQSTDPAIDIRPHLAAVLRTTLSALAETLPPAALETLHASLALECTRELAKLYPSAPEPTSRLTYSNPSSTVPQDRSRIGSLARKDALSYLTTLLRLVLPPRSLPLGVDPASCEQIVDGAGLLRSALADELAALMCRARPVDEEERPRVAKRDRPMVHEEEQPRGRGEDGARADGERRKVEDGVRPRKRRRLGCMDHVAYGTLMAVVERAIGL